MSYIKQSFEDNKTVLSASHLQHIENGIVANEKYTNLKGKKLSILGDSISTFNGWIPSGFLTFYPAYDIKSVDQTWWKQLVDITGLELLVNGSWSGSAVSFPRQGSVPACNAARINALEKDGVQPDIIITLIGINDFSEDKPVGNWSGGVLPTQLDDNGRYESFSHGYALMIANLMRKYPNAEIFCGTILDATTFGGSQYDSVDPGTYPTAFTNSDGSLTTVYDYNKAIRTVAEALGANVLDMHACGITYFNDKTMFGDGLHPSAAGAKLMAKKAAVEIAAKSRWMAIGEKQCTITYKYQFNGSSIKTDTIETVSSGTNKTFSTVSAPFISGYAASSVNPSGTKVITDDITVTYTYIENTNNTPTNIWYINATDNGTATLPNSSGGTGPYYYYNSGNYAGKYVNTFRLKTTATGTISYGLTDGSTFTDIGTFNTTKTGEYETITVSDFIVPSGQYIWFTGTFDYSQTKPADMSLFFKDKGGNVNEMNLGIDIGWF